jgi:hypothetical protein
MHANLLLVPVVVKPGLQLNSIIEPFTDATVLAIIGKTLQSPFTIEIINNNRIYILF